MATDKQTKKRSRRRWVTGIVIAALLVGGGMAIWLAFRPPPVEVVTARRGALEKTLSAVGVVESFQAEVAPKIIGRVEEILLEEGDMVKAGDLTAILESDAQAAALAQAQAALAAARAEAARAASALQQEKEISRARIAQAQAAYEAALARLADLRAGARPQEIEETRQALQAAQSHERLAEGDFARIQQLYEGGAASQAELDQARTRLENARAARRRAEENLALIEAGARQEELTAARAEAEAARAQVDQAQAAAGQVEVLKRVLEAAQAQVRQAEAALAAADSVFADTRVYAPIDGFVGRRFLDQGDLAGPANPIYMLADNERMWVVAEVDEEDVALVHEGQAVEVTAESLERPLAGKVVEVGPVAVSRGLQQVRAKIVRSRVILEDYRGALRTGMEVDVTGTTVAAQDAVLLENEAIGEEQGESFVYVVENGRLARRVVEVGHVGYQQSQIVSGLDAGEEVALQVGELELEEGMRIRPQTTGQDGS